MNICMVGNGAFAKKHLNGLARIENAKVTSIVGRRPEGTQAIAEQYGIPHWTTEIDEAIIRDDVDAVILTSPTQVHAEQALKCMAAGKHVEIEIPAIPKATGKNPPSRRPANGPSRKTPRSHAGKPRPRFRPATT